MPELPDIEAYLEALRSRVLGEELLGIRLVHPFLLRTVEPPLEAAAGRPVAGLSRLGKRLVFELGVGAAERGRDAPLFLVLHLMIAGRLQWLPPDAPVARGRGLAAFDFTKGTLLLTEAGKKRRASLHLLAGRAALAGMDPWGLEVLDSSLDEFVEAFTETNHTLKRALTDPHILSGIGNAYSDEILHRARLSPFRQTGSLSPAEMERLHQATLAVLGEWTQRLVAEARADFPAKVTAFRPEMSVHGKYGQPCPVCGTAVQRIKYAENEANYCPRCQTEGRMLADRSLSRLLKADWPRTVDEPEARGRTGGSGGFPVGAASADRKLE